MTAGPEGRIGQAFANARAERRPALVIYLCAGDPSLDATFRFVRAAFEAGADVIELGMPFSEPSADGPVLQRASERALRGGATLRGVLALAERLRTAGENGPLLLFGYANPIVRMGEDAFLSAAAAAGVDGLLVVDVPVDEARELSASARRRGIDWIPLVAPTTPGARVDEIADVASAFLYFVSVTGVTGAAQVDFAEASRMAVTARARTAVPVAVGFGVRTEADARALAEGGVDGVVVGSAVTAAIEAAGSVDEAERAVRELVSALRRGLERR